MMTVKWTKLKGKEQWKCEHHVIHTIEQHAHCDGCCMKKAFPGMKKRLKLKEGGSENGKL